MRIVRVETIQSPIYANLLWVQLQTDEGITGLGETFFGPDAVAAYIHETAAPYLLGKDPRQVERHHSVLSRTMLHRSMGAEARGLSSLDIAMWDLFGQSVRLPIYSCLGGPVRESIRIYNTCAGYGYNLSRRRQPGADSAAAWGVGGHDGEFEDLAAWQHQDGAGALAKSLLAMGITAMKIWPFDRFADATNGQSITAAQIEEGLRPFRQIRDAVGIEMEIAVEFHSRWNLPSALRLAQALEEVQPLWFEDPICMDDIDALVQFARSTRVPTAASETLSSRYAFRELLEKRAADIVMFDPCWVGGISEARKIAAMAEAYHLPVVPHDCTGPVSYIVGTHLCQALPNAMIQEGVRAYYLGWYQDVVEVLPRLERGLVSAPNEPGLGTRLRPEFTSRADTKVLGSSL